MSTLKKEKCQRCGASVPSESTERLCPACLLSGALETWDGEDETISEAAGEMLSVFGPTEFPFEFGGYRLLGLLGRGGMGTVYEAEDLSTGRRVALKTLGQQIDSPELRQRFLREGRLAAGVNHPNSLYIFGSEEIEGLPVITMEIAGGGTLQDILKKRGPFPVTEAVDAILDVISGLESAQANGVLHRDIKPSNCFVSPDGSVKVGDFGLSVSTLSQTDTFVTTFGRIMGTPAYASPEQLRGDVLDVRADIYSVGATLYTLLTDKVPFEGENAVQVVANAIDKKPRPISELKKDVPPGLERIVARCLAKEPAGRYSSYTELRNTLLPFSSREPEPASMKLRIQAGWIDYLIAFLVPYVILMLYIGNEEFHFRLFLERTLYSSRYYATFLGCGLLYFLIAEGIWGAGFGKRFKGLSVVRKNGRTPGLLRALVRFFVPVLLSEGIRVPLLLTFITANTIDELTWPQVALFSVATFICPSIPPILGMRARAENGFVTLWDWASGTKVVVKPLGSLRPSVKVAIPAKSSIEMERWFGPYRIDKEIVPGKWIAATDPILKRHIWLLKRTLSEPSVTRRSLSRPGRLRWLQQVEVEDCTWDAFEAVQGTSFLNHIEGYKSIPWSTLRFWLHDLASELWSAVGDKTLPAELGPDNVWITQQGQAVILDEPLPDKRSAADLISVRNIAGQQQFLSSIAGSVEYTNLPLHARPVLQNLAEGKFEKLSFLTGNLRGLLDRPAEVSSWIRAGSMFMIPLYIWIMLFIGSFTAEGEREWYLSGVWAFMMPLLLVVVGSGLVQLLEIPIRTTVGHSIFRLAVVDQWGEPAGLVTLLFRWLITWVPLIIPMSAVAFLIWKSEFTGAFILSVLTILLWLGAACYSLFHPNRGLHDRLAGTWVVRR
jgi:uncharacterized RDD family membrane protein YckC